MGKKPTEYSSNGNEYRAAALVAAAGIAGCGASSSLSQNVVPGARMEAEPLAKLPTPFGRSLASDGYWQVSPDFGIKDTFYFTNGNELVVVSKSNPMGLQQLARDNAGARVRNGALFAQKYGVGGDTTPEGDISISINDYHTNNAGNGKVSVYARGSIPLSQLPPKRHKDFLEQANLEARVGVPEAEEDTAEPSASVESTVDSVEANTTASVGVATVPPGEEARGSPNYWAMGGIIGAAVLAVTIAFFGTIYMSKRQQQNK